MSTSGEEYWDFVAFWELIESIIEESKEASNQWKTLHGLKTILLKMPSPKAVWSTQSHSKNLNKLARNGKWSWKHSSWCEVESSGNLERKRNLKYSHFLISSLLLSIYVLVFSSVIDLCPKLFVLPDYVYELFMSIIFLEVERASLSIQSMILSGHLILYRPLLCPSILGIWHLFSDESITYIVCKYWNFSSAWCSMNIRNDLLFFWFFILNLWSSVTHAVILVDPLPLTPSHRHLSRSSPCARAQTCCIPAIPGMGWRWNSAW